jgi:hypothetical protein
MRARKTMDLGRRRHYVAGAMELLLILSALLSAATGAFTGTRGPEAAQSHEAAAEAVAVAQSAIAVVAPVAAPERSLPVASRPEQPLPMPAAAPALEAPLRTERLIE